MTYQEMKDQITKIQDQLSTMQRELDKKDEEQIADKIDELFRPLREVRGMIVESKLSEEQGRNES